MDENASTRFSISEDNITEIKLPIRRVYGVTGQVVSSKSDSEGLTVEILKGNEVLKRTLTTFGGQFAFDGLKPDNYTVRLYDSNEVAYTKDIIIQSDNSEKYLFNIK